MNLGTDPPPNPGAGNDAKGLAKPFRVACAMAEAKCVDADPTINAGGYSPMTHAL